MRRVRVLAKGDLEQGTIQVGPHVEALSREQAESMSVSEMLDRCTVFVPPAAVAGMRDYVRSHPEMELVE